MGLITNVARQSQQSYGTFTPHSDSCEHVSAFAAVEGGKGDGRWPSVRDAHHGLRVGVDGKFRIPYKEFRYSDGENKGKPHDIEYDGVKLREIIALKADIEEKHKYEGQLSRTNLEQFEAIEAQKSVESGNIRKTLEHTSIEKEL